MDGGSGQLPRSRIDSGGGFVGLRQQQHRMLPFQAPVAVDVGDEQQVAGCREEVVNPRLPASEMWQRMKWTDDMVRLLIRSVYKVGDDGAGGGADGERQKTHAVKGKTKSAAAVQKKGKWKSVSAAMMEEGFFVSPQQCDDKFNDLNKRYKRVNELLGKGAACRVVENQALLDSLRGLSAKAKEEVRKLLNSKHLFFPEMCAYHHAGSAADASAQLQICFYHPSEKDADGDGGGETEDDDEGNDMFSDEEDEDCDAYEYEEDGDSEHNPKRHRQPGGDDGGGSKEFAKRQKTATSQRSASSACSSMQQLRMDLMPMSGAEGGGEEPSRQWLGRRTAELQEQRVAFQSRVLRLERQRFKWLHLSANKEREMKRMKLDNERRRLNNDRMLLMLRQKEFELTHGGGGATTAEQQYSPDHASVEA